MNTQTNIEIVNWSELPSQIRNDLYSILNEPEKEWWDELENHQYITIRDLAIYRRVAFLRNKEYVYAIVKIIDQSNNKVIASKIGCTIDEVLKSDQEMLMLFYNSGNIIANPIKLLQISNN